MPQYRSISKIAQAMVGGKTGEEFYRIGKRFFANYQPIEGTDGWSLCIAVGVNDMMSTFYLMFSINIILMILFVVASVFLAKWISTPIVEPIMLLEERIKLLAMGDLHSKVPEIESRDETHELAHSLETTINNLKIYIHEIESLL